MNTLTVKKLNYANILKDINIDFKNNSLNYISGSNNCGKTTLIKVISGIIEVKNSVFYKDKDITELNSYDYSNIFSTAFYIELNDFNFMIVDQFLSYYLDKIKIDTKEKQKRYKYLVELFDLKEQLYLSISDLSLYKKICILLVSKLIKNPKVLFIDNLFIHLSRKKSISIIQKLKSINNLTIIMASNNLDLCTESDYITILDDGKVVLSGDTKTMLKEDSKLNKIGLELPFMVDLSIKLKYYDLVNNIELDMSRMVNELWK